MKDLARILQDDPGMAKSASSVIEDLQMMVRSSVPELSETAWKMIAVALRDQDDIGPMSRWLDERISELILTSEDITCAEELPADAFTAICQIFEIGFLEQLAVVDLVSRYLKTIGDGPIRGSVKRQVTSMLKNKGDQSSLLWFGELAHSEDNPEAMAC